MKLSAAFLKLIGHTTKKGRTTGKTKMMSNEDIANNKKARVNSGTHGEGYALSCF
jgi:hypothetical protein